MIINNKSFKIPSTIAFSEVGNVKYKNPHLTYCSLKILHSGETVDGRKFTLNLIDDIIKQLPHTPIVGNYIEDKKDFGGHDTPRQVYGFIPEVEEYELQEIDGEAWLVADVALFTGVTGGVGDIAAEIPGKSQSLELDFESAEYEIVDNKIIFTSGTIRELMVLGDDKNPAFAGSGFFATEIGPQTTMEETLNALISQYAEVSQNVLSFTAPEENIDGGVRMEKFYNFMRETYGEKFDRISEKLSDVIGHNWFYVAQFNEDTIVYYDYDNAGKYYRVSYEDGEEVTFGEPIEVVERYLTEEEVNATFEEHSEDPEGADADNPENEGQEENDNPDINATADEGAEGDVVPEVEDDEEGEGADEVNYEEIIADLQAQLFAAENELNEQKGTVESLTTQNGELEKQVLTYQRQEKLDLLSTFADQISETDLTELSESVDNFTVETLEKEAGYRAYSFLKENMSKESPARFGAFPRGTTREVSDDDLIAELIKSHKN